MANLRVVQRNPETRELDTIEYNVPECVVSILDKKVRDVALNCLEALVDWLLTNLYTAYNTLHDLKVAARREFTSTHNTGNYRVFHLHNGLPFYDFSRDQRGSLVEIAGREYIALNDAHGHARAIAFSPDQTVPLPDFTPENTDFLSLTNRNLRAEAPLFDLQQARRGERGTSWQVALELENRTRQIAGTSQQVFVVKGDDRSNLDCEDAPDSLVKELERRNLPKLDLRRARSSQGLKLFYITHREVHIFRQIPLEDKHVFQVDRKSVYENRHYLQFTPNHDPEHFVLVIQNPQTKGYLICEYGKPARELVFPLFGDPYCKPLKLHRERLETKAKGKR